MEVYYIVKNYAGTGQDHKRKMDMDLVCKNLKQAGCSLNVEKIRDAVSYGIGVIVEEFQIEILPIK